MFKRGILTSSWKINDSKRVNGITAYPYGKTLHKQNWGSILDNQEVRIIRNSNEKEEMTIQDKEESKAKFNNLIICR